MDFTFVCESFPPVSKKNESMKDGVMKKRKSPPSDSHVTWWNWGETIRPKHFEPGFLKMLHYTPQIFRQMSLENLFMPNDLPKYETIVKSLLKRTPLPNKFEFWIKTGKGFPKRVNCSFLVFEGGESNPLLQITFSLPTKNEFVPIDKKQKLLTTINNLQPVYISQSVSHQKMAIQNLLN